MLDILRRQLSRLTRHRSVLCLALVVTTSAAPLTAVAQTNVPPCVHPTIGTSVKAPDGSITLTLTGKRQAYGGDRSTYDNAINSPKSVNISVDNSKFYVNSLEGATTVVYDLATQERLKIIRHTFDQRRDAALWAPPSGLYPWRHYKDRETGTFFGKPVESTFSHDGRYLWVPYYRRSFDINAQDPSAVAIIDTRTDSIVRMMETGPLPKMIRTSPDGRHVAIAHWGNNTVGIIDISGNDPQQWRHERVLVVDYVLPLDFPLDHSVDRDNGSGYALRGTVFTPDGRYLLVGCMGGGGGIAVIDMQTGQYLGRVLGMMTNVRHLLVYDDYLYLSINGAGMVQRTSLSAFIKTAQQMDGTTKKTANHTAWENAKVGTGARTIEISPDGRFIFAACNNASQISVVDTRTMKQILAIAADSYPVGLAISDDGHYLLSTSQGRNHVGGNAVDIFRIDYAEEPAPRPRNVPSAADSETSGADSGASGATSAPQQPQSGGEPTAFVQEYKWPLVGAAAFASVLLGIGIYRHCKNA